MTRRPFTGGCACGAVRYEIADEPLAMNHCQCLDCQKASGTGHGSYLTFQDRRAVRMEGEASLWDRVADSGELKTRGFCPVCGAPVFLTFSAMPELFTVHAGSLDEPERFAAQMATYAMRGLAWDTLDPAVPKFETMPPM